MGLLSVLLLMFGSRIIAQLNSGCGSVVNNTLTSPAGYPHNYPCNWNMSIPPGHVMNVSFKLFDLKADWVCGFDYVEIKDSNKVQVGKYCGDSVGWNSVVVTGDYAVISFFLSQYFSKDGKKCQFYFNAQPRIVLCGAAMGNILRSPIYAQSYPPNMHCVYNISVPQGKVQKLVFQIFELAFDPHCRNDYLNISNGTNIIGQYCGNLTGEEIRVSHNYLVLTFHTGRRFNQTNRGFEIFFTEDVKMPAPCPPGWVSSVYGSCFKISSEPLEGNSAKAACEALGSSLIVLNSKPEIQELTGRTTSHLWIGLRKDSKGTWLWVDGSRVFFEYWWPGEPNHAHTAEECSVMSPYVKKWNDVPCGYKYNYVCEIKGCPPSWIQILGSCFRTWPITLDWFSAEFACDAVRSYLARVNSQTEQQALGSYVGKSTWIGLHRKPKENSSWVWVGDSQANYINEVRNQLDNLTDQENCVEINSKGQLNKRTCSHHLHYACTIQAGTKCKNPSSGDGMVVSDCRLSTQQYGMTCSFNCARGYRVSGPSSARCGIGGAWSEDIHTVRCHECENALGMGDGAISDGQISASSQLDAHHGAINGRLTSTTLGSWSAFNNDVSEWLQIDLGSQESTILAKIATQGENANSQWVKNYTLLYSGTGMTFQIYKEQGKSEGKVFDGNTDPDTIVSHKLNPPIRARYVRFLPTAWNKHISMRVELYGCKGTPKFHHWFLDGSDAEVRYIGPVHYIDGWCPGSKAAYFSKNGSYVTLPIINITNCDFTIAFWIKSFGLNGPLMALWSMSGRLFYATIKNSRVILSIFNSLEKTNFGINFWNHIAVTCTQSQIKVFVNGTEIPPVKEQWNEYLFLLATARDRNLSSENVIGNDPDLLKLPLVNGTFDGAVMDLHVIGIALSANKISDLSKGKPKAPVIYNKENEINGCTVNLSWSRGVCATTKNTIRYREINPQGNAAELLDLTVDEPAITFHIMTLDCDKIYEIAVSSWFGELQSDWSISWRVKTNSVNDGTSKSLEIAVGITAALVAAIIVGIIFYRKKQKEEERSKKEIIHFLSLEVSPERVTIMEELGRGAFGRVHKGVVKEIPKPNVDYKNRQQTLHKNEGRIIAVKVLLENAGEEEKRQFLQEIDLMKDVSSHPNILSIFGFWVRSEPIMLIMEYVPHGDLLQWLRNKRQQFTKKKNDHTDVLEILEPPAPVRPRLNPAKEEGPEEDMDGWKIKEGEEENEKPVANDSKQMLERPNPQKSKKTTFDDSVESQLEIPPQFSILEEDSTSLGQSLRNQLEVATNIAMAGGERPTYQLTTFEEPKKSDEISFIIEKEDRNKDANGKHEEIESLENAKNESQGDPVNVLSSETKPGKREHEKRIQSVPQTFEDDQLPESFKSTEVRICVEQDEDTCDNDHKDYFISADDIMCFAWQIAKGMEYLASKGFVHRDLAARNILLGENKAVKISDFGLLRRTGESEIYEVATVKKLPIKWTAPEALQTGSFTSKSDVWSFGVLLWEMATMGGTPYPGISHAQLHNALKTGYRMEQPNTCSDEIYKLMLDCWNDDPNERPSFSEMIPTLEQMMTADTPYYDFTLLDESQECYNDQCPSTSKTDGYNTRL